MTLAGHPRENGMYNSMLHHFFWWHIGNDVHVTAKNSDHAPKLDMKRSISVSFNYFQLLNHLSMWPLTYWKHYWNQCLVTNTWFFWPMATLKSFLQCPPEKFHLCIFWLYSSTAGTRLYGIRNYVLTAEGPKFVSKCFTTLCLFFSVKRQTPTAYHPQTNS